MANHIEFEDPEVYRPNANEKIDFQLILFKQLDVIRFERTNIIDIAGNIKDHKYINAILSFKLLLTTYLDEQFKENMNKFKSNERHPIKKRLAYYDKMLEELLLLCERTKLIGGDVILT